MAEFDFDVERFRVRGSSKPAIERVNVAEIKNDIGDARTAGFCISLLNVFAESEPELVNLLLSVVDNRGEKLSDVCKYLCGENFREMQYDEVMAAFAQKFGIVSKYRIYDVVDGGVTPTIASVYARRNAVDELAIVKPKDIRDLPREVTVERKYVKESSREPLFTVRLMAKLRWFVTDKGAVTIDNDGHEKSFGAVGTPLFACYSM